MVIKDISFVGFLKLNVFLILLPSLLNLVVLNAIRLVNPFEQSPGLQSGDIPSKSSEPLPPVGSGPQNPEDLSPTLELAFTMAPRILMPFILVYFLAKVVHFLAQHTKVGEIQIGETSA